MSLRTRDQLRKIFYTTLFPPGEVADKLSIALLKLDRIDNLTPTEEEGLLDQYDKAWLLLIDLLNNSITDSACGTAETTISFLNALRDLIISNSYQWDYESKVRKEQTAEAAVNARRQNNKRTKLKNTINLLLGGKKELKQYPEIVDLEKKEE